MRSFRHAAGVLSAGVATLTLLAAPSAFAQQTLTVWFTKGFYPAEDIALDAMIARFEKKAGVKVELSKYAIQDMIPKTVAALDAGNVPDFAFSHSYDFQATGKWAREGKLVDLTSILEPKKDIFLQNTLSTTHLLGPDNKKSYYAMPVYQQTIHVNYWRDMLQEAGFKDEDVPREWNAFWSFWCDKVQPASRKATGKRAFGIGQPMGVDATDSFFSFMQYLLAYNVKLVDDDGKLLVDDPKHKEGMVKALKDYVVSLQKGCTPTTSTSWKDPDNNVNFHNKTTIMTHNATISIAAKWLDDMNNSALTDAQRAQAKKNYEENVATIYWPNKPDGSPMTYLAAIKTAVVFKGAKNEALAKQFAAFMLEDENLIPYTEGALGRWYPVTKTGADSKFWTSGEDKARKIVSDQFRAGTGVFPFVANYKFTQLNNENVWAKAMSRVVNERWTPEKAVDEMVARIKEIAGTM